jgi:hypothetical protein
MSTPSFTVERLAWDDEILGEVPTPRGRLVLRSSFGSGLARRRSDPQGRVWAIGDRGPNLKVKDAVKLYGLDHLAPLRSQSGAKIMPRPDLGPAIAELQVAGDRIELIRTLRLTGKDGVPVSGLPVPDTGHDRTEPVFDLDGHPLPADGGGLDTEGIAALADGGFWVGDEFGPSLVRLDAEGRILVRLVPEGVRLDAAYPVEARLPAIAARRQLNRGFEALTLSEDGQWLFLAFQSPLAHPDEAAHEAAAHVRLWRLDAESGAVLAEYLYPLDPPESFARDVAKDEKFNKSDIKVSEIVCAGADTLLVLERGSETTKIYRARLSAACELPPEHLDLATRPSVEEHSGAGGAFPLPVLPKQSLFTTDDAPQISPDLEGMVILSPHELLLVNDNDFGVEGAETSFWRVTFEEPVLGDGA